MLTGFLRFFFRVCCWPWPGPRALGVRGRPRRLEPDFVIHMGDLVHPVPGHPTFGQVAEDFNKLYQTVKSPLHIIPGNHDCGDKKISWMPAVQVNDAFLEDHYF